MKKLLNTLYITTPDRYLSLDGENIVIHADRKEIGRIPLHNLERIMAFGSAGASPALMGKCVSEYADIAIITSDNPRFEDPVSIIEQVRPGFSGNCRTETYTDRLEAIKYAVSIAAENDVIALCGKGHEEYQVIGDDYIPFSEHNIIKELLGKEEK